MSPLYQKTPDDFFKSCLANDYKFYLVCHSCRFNYYQIPCTTIETEKYLTPLQGSTWKCWMVWCKCYCNLNLWHEISSSTFHIISVANVILEDAVRGPFWNSQCTLFWQKLLELPQEISIIWNVQINAAPSGWRNLWWSTYFWKIHGCFLVHECKFDMSRIKGTTLVPKKDSEQNIDN